MLSRKDKFTSRVCLYVMTLSHKKFLLSFTVPACYEIRKIVSRTTYVAGIRCLTCFIFLEFDVRLKIK